MVCARGAACQPRRCQVSYKSQPPPRDADSPILTRRFSASPGVNPTVRLQAMGTETATGVWSADPRCLAGRVAPWCPASPTEADWTPESGRLDQAGEEESPSDSVPLVPPLLCFFCCSRPFTWILQPRDLRFPSASRVGVGSACRSRSASALPMRSGRPAASSWTIRDIDATATDSACSVAVALQPEVRGQASFLLNATRLSPVFLSPAVKARE
jgi:hypothetical protein